MLTPMLWIPFLRLLKLRLRPWTLYLGTFLMISIKNKNKITDDSTKTMGLYVPVSVATAAKYDLTI